MIWAANADGHVTYLGPEWSEFTGQSPRDAEGSGWLNVTYPGDRELIGRLFLEACSRAAEFWLRFRLQRACGGHVWVLGGAMPSFSPHDGQFLGFLGSLTEVEPSGSIEATGEIGAFRPPPMARSTMPHSAVPHSAVDLIADHTLMARSVAHQAGEHTLRKALDGALLEIGRALAKRTPPVDRLSLLRVGDGSGES